MINVRNIFMSTVVVASTALTAIAQDDFVELDFYIARSATDNSTVFGTISDESPDALFFPGERAVAVEFGPFLPGTIVAEEPGFFNPGTGGGFVQAPGAIAPFEGDGVNVDFIDVEIGDLSGSPLFFWDGTGPVNFTAVPDLFDDITVDQVEDVVSATGFIDDHPVITFENGPPEGLYLTSLTTNLISADGLSDTDPTEPLFVVFGTPTIGEAQLDAALTFVNAALVPEPSSAALMAFAAVGLLRRRQK